MRHLQWNRNPIQSVFLNNLHRNDVYLSLLLQDGLRDRAEDLQADDDHGGARPGADGDRGMHRQFSGATRLQQRAQPGRHLAAGTAPHPEP